MEDGRELLSAHLNAYTTILAGGIGSRFWPASTPDRPKQFLPLASRTPLIEETLDRAVELVGAPRVRVVASRRLVDLMQGSLEERGVQSLSEPRARGTGPALVWAAHRLESEHPGAIMISMHADHRISPFEGLRETLAEAVERARDGFLCCVGVRPSRPEIGYGYVELGEELTSGSYEVKRFVEKPDEETARSYVDSGRFLWNSGIFIWRAADLLAAAAAHATELGAGLPRLDAGDVAGFFDEVEPVAIDVCVMERAGRVATVEARFDWDDLGVWSAIGRSRGVDADGNTVVGAARLLDATDNVVWTESVRATLIGVSDLVVVEANGELLVMARDEAPRLGVRIAEIEAAESARDLGEGAVG